jgi:hypothetical protein
MDKFEFVGIFIAQVGLAVPDGGSERDVTTYITPALWVLWCRAFGWPDDTEPTAWLGLEDTRGVYGSHTVIIRNDSTSFLSCSFPTPTPKTEV